MFGCLGLHRYIRDVAGDTQLGCGCIHKNLTIPQALNCNGYLRYKIRFLGTFPKQATTEAEDGGTGGKGLGVVIGHTH